MDICDGAGMESPHVRRNCVEIKMLKHGLVVTVVHSNGLDGVPKKILLDNAKCAITKACYHDPDVQRSYAEYAEGYGFIISPCPPRDPQKKGRVESGVKYVKKNFLPFRDFRNQSTRSESTAKIMDTGNSRQS